MQAVVIIAFFGLGSSLFGSILLAVSLNSLLKGLTLTTDAHDLTIQMLTDPNSNVVVFTGLETHVKQGEIASRRRTVLGILMIGIGTVLQAVAVLLSVQM